MQGQKSLVYLLLKMKAHTFVCVFSSVLFEKRVAIELFLIATLPIWQQERHSIKSNFVHKTLFLQ